MIRLTHDRPLRSLTFVTDGHLIAVGRLRRGPCAAVWWQWDTATVAHRFESVLFGVSPNGEFVVRLTLVNEIIAHHGPKRQILNIRRHARNVAVRDLHVSDDGQELIVLDSTWLQVFAAPFEEPTARRLPVGMNRIRVSPGGRWVIATGDGHDIYDRNRAFAGTPPSRLNGGRVLAFAPDDALVAFTPTKGTNVRLRTSLTRTEATLLVGHDKQVTAAVFTPDARQVVTGSKDGTVKLWEATTGLCIQTYDWQLGPVTCLAVSPDGAVAAAGGESGGAVVWDLDG